MKGALLTLLMCCVQGTVTIGASLVALYAGAQNALSGQTIAFYSGGTLLGTGLTDASVSPFRS